MRAVNIIIKGRVQGVFFRKYTQQKATELNLVGYVKNLVDGSVNSKAFGSTENIKTFIDWCYNGSPLSKVTEVLVEELVLDEHANYQSFSIV